MATDPRLLQAQAKAAAYDRAHAEGYVDEGLRSYMLRVYNYMASALALTAIVAAGMAMNPSWIISLSQSGLIWVPAIATLGLVFFLSFRVHKLSATTAQALFWAYAALNGVTFSIYFLIYTGESIGLTFAVTAATFGAMSLYGYTTKRDLTGMGSFLFMGLIGLIIAMVVNIFLQSTILHFAASAIGVLIFTGLTAYDTQRIKSMYFYLDGAEAITKGAVMGALALYLDFINLFIMLLQFLGNRE